jgi:hypothetical protein
MEGQWVMISTLPSLFKYVEDSPRIGDGLGWHTRTVYDDSKTKGSAHSIGTGRKSARIYPSTKKGRSFGHFSRRTLATSSASE